MSLAHHVLSPSLNLTQLIYCFPHTHVYVLLLGYLAPHHHLLIQLALHLLHVHLRLHLRVHLWRKRKEKVWSNGEWFCNLHSVHHDNRQQNVPLSMCMSTNTIFVILPRCMLMAAPNTSRTWNHRPLTL